jgi:Holliday junction resolvase-like predicted endonuclease
MVSFSMPKVNKAKVSNEKKNLSRLAGEFLVASRLTQRGYMVALQWGTTIGYDILVFDKTRNVAYVEVKATAAHPRKWLLQKKYATATASDRFICCVDLTPEDRKPDIYVFPAKVVADGLHYFYGKLLLG